MYTVYTTRAFVLSYRNIKEGDRIFTFFTENFGLINAKATSIRLEKSKLRSHLKEYSLVNVSLVRGKEFWRLISAENISSFMQNENKDKNQTKIFVRIFALIQRFFQGEDLHKDFFLDLIDSQNIDSKYLEHVLVLNMLFKLGYIKSDSSTEAYLNKKITLELCQSLEKDIKGVLVAINQGLRVSQL